VLRNLLVDEYKHNRRLGGAGAERLIEHEPAVAQVLVGPLLDALELPGSLDHYMGDPRGDLTGALAAALRADPGGTATAIERRGATAPRPVRDALFSVHDATAAVRWLGDYGRCRGPIGRAAITIEGGALAPIISGASRLPRVRRDRATERISACDPRSSSSTARSPSRRVGTA
jgi:hypothetical protein